MKKPTANKVYDILVKIGGAEESMRDSFIIHHRGKDRGMDVCKEWRFMGRLGYGGKYRSNTNTVDCYPEDETPTRKEMVEKINNLLKDIS